ncbi:MAG: chemotaxis protein CheX [Planctomycetes bacterium]|nr:chemotaxis protein CheX [Planctomycetota bacterium]
MLKQECFAEALLDGAREVFETMMFMTIDDTVEEGTRIQGEALLGSITFKGGIEGCLAVCCDMECAKTIAINMLGMEPGEDIGEDEVADAMGEVANMVMGSLKSRILESVGELNVSIPSVVTGNELVSSLGEDSGKIDMIVSIDEMPAKFSLLYRDAAA